MAARQSTPASALRQYMTSQQSVGNAVRADGTAPRRVSYLNHENVLGSHSFAVEPTEEDFEPRFHTATVQNPQTGLAETWLGVQWASKYDGTGVARHGRPPLSVVMVLDISGSMSMALEGDEDEAEVQPFAPRRSKLTVAKSCLEAILGQLGAHDEVGVLLFNHTTHLLQPPTKCTAPAKAAILAKLERVQPGGGTAQFRVLRPQDGMLAKFRRGDDVQHMMSLQGHLIAHRSRGDRGPPTSWALKLFSETHGSVVFAFRMRCAEYGAEADVTEPASPEGQHGPPQQSTPPAAASAAPSDQYGPAVEMSFAHPLSPYQAGCLALAIAHHLEFAMHRPGLPPGRRLHP
jgi:hypothetical protein